MADGDSGSPQGQRGKSKDSGHVSVLLNEAIEFLAVRRGGAYVDATVGAGGHSFVVASRLGAPGRLIGFDKDPAALGIARKRLGELPPESSGDWPHLELRNASFAEIAGLPAGSLDGILADLGLSSLQLTDAERGFSFQAEGPLDMRMDPRSERTADQVVNRFDEEDLANLIYEFGEERRSRRIARAIVRARPIRSTAHLAQVVSAALRSMKSDRIHPATRTFQAIRIFVNRELEELEALLEAAPAVLRSGGRLGGLSVPSLEGRRGEDQLRAGAQRAPYRLLCKKPGAGGGEEEG